MTIYTRTGDNGTTSTFGGQKMLKSDLKIEAGGNLDELSSFIGLIITKLENKDQKKTLLKIQKNLYQIMGQISGAKTSLNNLETELKKIEQTIDKIESELPLLNRFILPGGTELSAWFHILRTICRRTERKVVHYLKEVGHEANSINDLILQYLNRLSDFFFMMARLYNQKNEKTI